MSYIKMQFGGNRYNDEIYSFLADEGFWQDEWHGKECLQYVQSGSLYRVWVMVYQDYIGYYVEYDCGGEIDSGTRFFDENDFSDFSGVYHRTVDSLVTYIIG